MKSSMAKFSSPGPLAKPKEAHVTLKFAFHAERCSYRRPLNSKRSSQNDFGPSLKHGTTIAHSCANGYTLVGQKTIRCNDGRWSPRIPKCKASCSDPGPISNGYQIRKTFLHRSIVKYGCNKGYTLDDPSQLLCDDGRWSKPVPSCKKGCTKPRHSPNGYVYLRKDFYNDDETVQMYCNRIYARVGDSSARCKNGKWNNDPPSCKRKCNNPGSPYHGWKVGNELFEGKQVRFACTNGYDLIGLTTIQCLDTGRWSGSVPERKRK